ncbi:MAG: hypothetical protein KDC85_09590 [Saprospiraceae bacterium]|nr:hypothetical protein [Saprospiraceae bacterium]MCB9322952.1 hypothetical protein [Lewinellaceae bacterium]
MKTTSNSFLKFESPIIRFSQEPKDFWTLSDALRGTQIFGGIGSGKTSGSGAMISKAFLENNFGGIVLCAKPDEVENWKRVAALTGRTKDLIIFNEDSPYRFNPLDYETNRSGKGAGETFNLVSLFMNIYQMGRNVSGEGLSRENDRFWDNAMKRSLKRMIDLLKLAKEPVSIRNMHRIILDAQKTDDIEEIMQASTDKNLENGQRKISEIGNYYGICIMKAIRNYASKNTSLKDQQKMEWELQLIINYFNREFAKLSDRTRTIIVESFLGIAEPFLGGMLKEFFAGGTSDEIKPEVCFDGKIIVLDFPIKNYLEMGVYVQGIYKLLWQQAMERRSFKDGRDRPVFLWVDESQMFLNDYDQIFQTTARSSGTATVYLSQNISNYYAAIGGRNPTAKVDSLLANLSTKIFHSNNDAVTNEWAAQTIGKSFRIIESFNVGEQTSAGASKQFHYQVEPVKFSVLKSGISDDEDKLEFGTYITVANRRWSNGKNFITYTFEKYI